MFCSSHCLRIAFALMLYCIALPQPLHCTHCIHLRCIALRFHHVICCIASNWMEVGVDGKSVDASDGVDGDDDAATATAAGATTTTAATALATAATTAAAVATATTAALVAAAATAATLTTTDRADDGDGDGDGVAGGGDDRTGDDGDCDEPRGR